jgi:hypothetical protein
VGDDRKKRFPEAEAWSKTERYDWPEECTESLAIWICGPSRGSLRGTCRIRGSASVLQCCSGASVGKYLVPLVGLVIRWGSAGYLHPSSESETWGKNERCGEPIHRNHRIVENAANHLPFQVGVVRMKAVDGIYLRPHVGSDRGRQQCDSRQHKVHPAQPFLRMLVSGR